MAKFNVPRRNEQEQHGPLNVYGVDKYKGVCNTSSYIPNPTNRSMDNKYIGPVNNITICKSYSHDPNDTPAITKRNIYQDTDRYGTSITGDQFVGHYYNKNDIRKNTREQISVLL